MFLFYLSVFIFSLVSPGRTGHHNINHVHHHHHLQDEFSTDGPTRIWKIWTEELSSRENCLKLPEGGEETADVFCSVATLNIHREHGQDLSRIS